MTNRGEIDLRPHPKEEPENFRPTEPVEPVEPVGRAEPTEQSPVQPPRELEPVSSSDNETTDKINTTVTSPEGKPIPVEVTVGSKDAPDTNKPAHTKFDEMERKFNRNIAEVRTLFPFSFFPTYIIVDEAQVTVIEYYFFFSKRVFPMFIKDIKTVTAAQGILLGELKFELSGYETNPEPIYNLKRGDVIRTRRIILGLMKAHEEKIDLSQFSDEELRKRLEVLGEKYGKA